MGSHSLAEALMWQLDKQARFHSFLFAPGLSSISITTQHIAST